MENTNIYSDKYVDTLLNTVIIGSHISNEKRIVFLSECIFSLILQKKPVRIYISISFETDHLERIFNKAILESKMVETFKNFYPFYYSVEKKKTPQMVHIQNVCNRMRNLIYYPHPEWIFFIDDDDTYSDTRTKLFVERIEECEKDLTANNLDKTRLVGLYESHDFGLNHKEQRHEYWCYCLRFSLLCEFFDRLKLYPDVIENKCCDIVLGEFLRRRKSADLFSFINGKFYNYRRENNTDSVTGSIMTNKDKKTRTPNPPSMNDISIVDYIIEFNDFLNVKENMDIYLHDTYLRTVVGVPFEDILKSEFMADYPLLEYVDICHVDKLRVFHDRLRLICLSIYDDKFPT